MTSPFLKQQEVRIEKELSLISDNLASLNSLLHWIRQKRDLPQANKGQWKQVIIRGETDGTMGMETVKELITWNPEATIILSGGVYGREKTIGDIGSIDMYRHLEHDLGLLGYHPDKIKNHVLIDSLSQHTHDQGKILSSLLSSIEAEDVFVVIPLYHMPRFLLSLAHSLKRINFKPNIIPLPYGSWETHHPRKGPINKPSITYTYQELFALPPTSSLFEGKMDCGEIDKMVQHAKNNQAMTIEQFNQWTNIAPQTINTKGTASTSDPVPVKL